MNDLVMMIFGALSAYLVGSIPTSFIFAKVLRGIDIRQFGSGNVGATNVFRVVGKLPALFALIIDILKGVFVVTVVARHSYAFRETLDYGFYRAALGYIAICGHIWPVFLGFRGGKGVATMIGATLAIAPAVFLISGGMWLMIFFLTNYVSLASIILAVSMPVFACILNQPFSTVMFTVATCLMSVYKHKENIKRLLRGEENKTVIRKKIKI